MKVSLRWLNEYLDLPTTDVDELKRAFDYLGHAVEETVHVTPGWTDVVIGRVARIEAHPDADNVRVTHVDLGDGTLHQIICGAWNFDEGAVVPVAIPGAVLPGGFEIGRRSIRGVESNGMICSESELGLGEGHDGIMVLEPDAPIGEPFASILEMPDVVFDLEITNNRPDVMGMVGVARELAAWFDVDMKPPALDLTTVPGGPEVDITISAPDGCNRFVAREIDDVTIGPSPLWIRERLRKAGVRSISNVVDVTNYVMLELGHPLHAFDADRIAGSQLDVRWAEPGETLVTLDGTERPLIAEDLVIVDGAGPTSLAAVMGGARSEVSADTTRVLMEAASWDPATVMYTSRRHDLRSEASARFERGVDPNLGPAANDRACRLLVEISGGTIRDQQLDLVANEFTSHDVELSIGEVRRLLGDRFETAESAALLRRLDLDVTQDGDTLTVTVPTYRPDLTRPADLIEEIARLSDFDTFPATVPTGPAGGLTREQRRTRRLHELLRGIGLNQAMNLPFVSPEEIAAFGLDAEVVTVKNPLRDDQAKLRPALLPALLRNVRDNRNRGARGVGLFETGRVFYSRPWPEDDRVPDQPNRLAVAMTGLHGTFSLSAAGEGADSRSVLAVLHAITTALEVPLDLRPAQPAGLHPARSADVVLNDVVIGAVGELHPDVAALFEITSRVGVLEIDLDPVVAPQPAAQMQPVSTFPHVDFDLSFAVAPDLLAADVVRTTAAASELVERVDVFDEYRHPETGDRSLAIRYRLRAPDRTLGGDEIAAIRTRMIGAATGLGASLRGAETGET